MFHKSMFEDIEELKTITKRLQAIRGEKRKLCPRWIDYNFSSINCWCYCAGPDGKTLNCPEKPENLDMRGISIEEVVNPPGVFPENINGF